MRPPESGSVLAATDAALGSTAGPQLPSGQPALSREVSPPGPPVADDATLRRLSSSANAKVATPPDMKKRFAGQAAVPAGGDRTGEEVPSDSKVAETTDVAAPTDAEGATNTSVMLDETSKSNFSELARSFAYMDTLA